MKNRMTPFIRINVNATDEIMRSSILSDRFPANDETNTTASGVASRNIPVKRASYPKTSCKYKFNMYEAINVMKYITNAE